MAVAPSNNVWPATPAQDCGIPQPTGAITRSNALNWSVVHETGSLSTSWPEFHLTYPTMRQ